MARKKKSEDKIEGTSTYAHVFKDNTLVEMIHQPKSLVTSFIVSRDGELEEAEAVYLDADGEYSESPSDAAEVLLPLSAQSPMVKSGFIKLPSAVAELGELSDLYKDLRTFIGSYVIMDKQFLDVAVTYIFMSWVYDRFNALPYLRVIGDYGTGKSRFLRVVGDLCYRPIVAGGSISQASLFRGMDMVRGSLIFDEADFRSSDISSEIVKILNCGHQPNSPVVRITGEGEDMKPQPFEVFGPKILVSRESYSDIALESRCITNRFRPLGKVDVPIHLPNDYEDIAMALRNRLLAFRLNHFADIKADESTLGDINFPRIRQSALALTSIANYVYPAALDNIIPYLLEYEKSLQRIQQMDVQADVLLCILRDREFNKTAQESGKLYMKDLAQTFNMHFYEQYAERETKKYDTKEGPMESRGQVVSARKLGSLVDKLGIPKERDGGGVYINLKLQDSYINQIAERYNLLPIIEKEKADKENLQKTKVPTVSQGSSVKSNITFEVDDKKPYPVN